MNKNKLSFFQRLFRKNKVSEEDYQKIGDVKSPQPQLEIHFTDAKTIIRFGLIIVFLFFGVGGLWITFAEITGAVIANGEVKVDTERKTVQHLEGGIVRKIFVRDGDRVTSGQPLMQLDTTKAAAITAQYRLQIAAYNLDKIRLMAERDFLTEPDWPANDETIPRHKFEELLASAKKVFSSNRLALENKVTLLRKQINQMQEQIKSMDDRLAADQQVSAALQEELDAKQILYEQKYIDKTQILEIRRALSERIGSQAQIRGSQAEIRERIAEYELRIDVLKSEYLQNAITELAKLQKELFAIQQQILPYQDSLTRQVVTAPVSGEVVAMQVHSEGGVVRPGQSLLDIVPKDSPLIVECLIQVTDITHVFVGQEADVQLVAFNTRTTPKISGEVVYISADRIMEKTSAGEFPVYIVHIELNKQELLDNNLYLTAGMPAVAYIRTKPRTVLDYALEPVKENFDRALRET